MRAEQKTFGRTTVRLMTGDITQVPAGAIVNAANSGLRGGGGVDGAIHRAGGPGILRALDEVRPKGGLAAGGAVATEAGRLPAEYVFHAVGPVWRGGAAGEAAALASCYRTCLTMAEERGVRTISFPSISTGAYGYPVDQAARVAMGAVADFLSRGGGEEPEIEEVLFVLFDEATFEAYAGALGVF